MKKITVLICLLAVLTLFSSCGKEISYKNDVDISAFLADITDGTPYGSTSFSPASEEYAEFFLNIDPALIDSSKIMLPYSASACDELGVFEAKDIESAEKVKTTVETYLSGKKESWDTRYNSDELYKVEEAKIRVFGRYVVYTVMPEETAEEIFSAFEGFAAE